MVALPSPRLLLLLQQSSHFAQRQSTNQYFNRNKSRKTQSNPSHASLPTLSINYNRSSNIATVSTNWQKCFPNSSRYPSQIANRTFPHFGIIAQNSHNQLRSRCKMFKHSSKRMSPLSSLYIVFSSILFSSRLWSSECKHFASLSIFVSSLTLLKWDRCVALDDFTLLRLASSVFSFFVKFKMSFLLSLSRSFSQVLDISHHRTFTHSHSFK